MHAIRAALHAPARRPFDAARFNRLAAYPLSALAFFGVGFLFALAV